MRILPDENLPKRLKRDFPEHEVLTVSDRGWNGASNGELLRMMIEDGFEALVTFDKNLQHRQNFEKYPIPVIVLHAASNQHKYLLPLVAEITSELEQAKAGVTIIGK